MGLITPTVLEMIQSGYYIKSYEALQRVLVNLGCRNPYSVKINDIIDIDKVVNMLGRSESSIWFLRKIRGMLELKEVVGLELKCSRVKCADKKRIHSKYKQMKPEEILRLAIEDNDISGYLVKTYTEINNELGVAKFNIHLIDSAYALMQYCGIVDDINESKLQVHTAILMHSLKQNGYNRVEIFKKAIEYVINKLED